jgi:hypothetical protein
MIVAMGFFGVSGVTALARVGGREAVFGKVKIRVDLLVKVDFL